jgi:hypothetical protein
MVFALRLVRKTRRKFYLSRKSYRARAAGTRSSAGVAAMWQTRDGDILPLSAVRLARVAPKNSARVVKMLSRAHRSIIATLVIRSPHRGDAFNESLLPVRRACVHSISRAGFTGRDQNKGSALRSSQMRAAGVCLNAAGSARLAMRHRSACETSVARGMRPIADTKECAENWSRASRPEENTRGSA